MSGLPRKLYLECREILLRCHEFESYQALRAVFVTDQLASFRSRLPTADNPDQLVDRCLEYLIRKNLAGGLPLLPVFLTALHDRYQPDDALHDKLETLRDTVQSAMAQSESHLTQELQSKAAEWNIAAIRQLLTAAFDDEELNTLCFDHFRSVYENFAVGMSKRQKIQQLVEYCDRHMQIEELLALIKELNPAQYSRFEGLLIIT